MNRLNYKEVHVIHVHAFFIIMTSSIISAVAVIRGLMFKKHGRLVITKIATTFLHLLLYLAFMVGITFCN